VGDPIPTPDAQGSGQSPKGNLLLLLVKTLAARIMFLVAACGGWQKYSQGACIPKCRDLHGEKTRKFLTYPDSFYRL
jgi:hypothetical protein